MTMATRTGWTRVFAKVTAYIAHSMKRLLYGLIAALCGFLIGTLAARVDFIYPVERLLTGREAEIEALQAEFFYDRPDIKPPIGWQKVDVDGLFGIKLPFSVYLPPEFEQDKVMGTEGGLWAYTGGQKKVSFIYEGGCVVYDRRHEYYGADFKEQEVNLPAGKATIFTWTETAVNHHPNPYVTELYVGDWRRESVKLDVRLYSESPDDQAFAEQIFRTIDVHY
jgi:hypothetical protein